MSVPKNSDHNHIKIKMPNPSQEPPASSKAPNQVSKLTPVNTRNSQIAKLSPSESRLKWPAKIWIMGLPKTSDYIKIKIKIPHPNLRQTEYLIKAELS